MKDLINIKKVIPMLNIFELLSIIVTLLMSFFIQIYLHELPCPLCLLQRMGFIAIAFGFLLNLRFGLRASHYSIVLLSALFTGFVALYQIFLHIIPGTTAYGPPFFGLHLYSWSFILSMIILIVTALILGVDRQYPAIQSSNTLRFPIMTHSLYALVVLLILGNFISLYLQCGISECPSNPSEYKMLQK